MRMLAVVHQHDAPAGVFGDAVGAAGHELDVWLPRRQVPPPVARPEIGWHAVDLEPEASTDPLLAPLPERVEGFQWHSYEAPLPPGAVALATSRVCLHGPSSRTVRET